MSKNVKIKIIVIIAVIALLGLGGFAVLHFGSDGSELEREEIFYKGDAAKIEKTDEQKETLIVGSSRIPLDNEPYLHETEVGYAVNKLVYEPLVDVKTDGEIVPVLAQSVDFTSDGLTVSVTLKSAQFSDGSKVTATDVLNAYLDLFASGSIYYDADKGVSINGYYNYITGESESISGIRVISDSVIEFSFANLTAKNIYALDVPIMKPSNTGYALGSGEYVIDEIKSGISMTLSKSKDSRTSDYDYKKIVFRSVSSEELSKAVRSFDMDVFLTNTTTMLDIIKASGYHDVYRLRENYYSYIGFNLSSKLGKNENVRKAIAYSVDRENVGKTFYTDYLTSLGTVSTSKTKNSFESNYPLDLAKANEYLTNATNELFSKDEQQTDIVDETKLSVNFLCQNDSYSNGFYLNMQKELLNAKINLTQTGVYETEYVQTLATMEGFDVYHKLNYENSPIEVIESIVIQDNDINSSYENLLRESFSKDYKSTLDSIEKFVDSKCLLIPTFAGDYYVAVSADCDKEAILDLIMP